MTDVASAEGHIQTVYYVLAIFGILGGGVVAYARKLQNDIKSNAAAIAATKEKSTEDINTAKATAAAELASFRESVARDYVSAARFDAGIRQVTDGIAHLGSRIDAMFHHPRPAE